MAHDDLQKSTRKVGVAKASVNARKGGYKKHKKTSTESDGLQGSTDKDSTGVELPTVKIRKKRNTRKKRKRSLVSDTISDSDLGADDRDEEEYISISHTSSLSIPFREGSVSCCEEYGDVPSYVQHPGLLMNSNEKQGELLALQKQYNCYIEDPSIDNQSLSTPNSVDANHSNVANPKNADTSKFHRAHGKHLSNQAATHCTAARVSKADDDVQALTNNTENMDALSQDFTHRLENIIGMSLQKSAKSYSFKERVVKFCWFCAFVIASGVCVVSLVGIMFAETVVRNVAIVMLPISILLAVFSMYCCVCYAVDTNRTELNEVYGGEHEQQTDRSV